VAADEIGFPPAWDAFRAAGAELDSLRAGELQGRGLVSDVVGRRGTHLRLGYASRTPEEIRAGMALLLASIAATTSKQAPRAIARVHRAE
jgi:hypothetical protein